MDRVYYVATYGFMSHVFSPLVVSSSFVLYNISTGAACPNGGTELSADVLDVRLNMVRTVHEVGKVDEVFSLIGIIIGQYTIIHEFPSKGVGDYDDDSSVRCIVGRFSGVGI